MILSDLSPRFQGHNIIQRQITQKRYKIDLQWWTNKKSYAVYRMAPFWMTLNDPYPGFKVTPFFDAEYLRNGKRYRHSVNGILIGTYTGPTQQCHFAWPWVTLNDLATYLMTRSVARSFCDSWASCLQRDAVARCLSVHLSHAGILSKKRNGLTHQTFSTVM